MSTRPEGRLDTVDAVLRTYTAQLAATGSGLNVCGEAASGLIVVPG